MMASRGENMRHRAVHAWNMKILTTDLAICLWPSQRSHVREIVGASNRTANPLGSKHPLLWIFPWWSLPRALCSLLFHIRLIQLNTRSGLMLKILWDSVNITENYYVVIITLKVGMKLSCKICVTPNDVIWKQTVVFLNVGQEIGGITTYLRN